MKRITPERLRSHILWYRRREDAGDLETPHATTPTKQEDGRKPLSSRHAAKRETQAGNREAVTKRDSPAPKSAPAGLFWIDALRNPQVPAPKSEPRDGGGSLAAKAGMTHPDPTLLAPTPDDAQKAPRGTLQGSRTATFGLPIPKGRAPTTGRSTAERSPLPRQAPPVTQGQAQASSEINGTSLNPPSELSSMIPAPGNPLTIEHPDGSQTWLCPCHEEEVVWIGCRPVCRYSEEAKSSSLRSDLAKRPVRGGSTIAITGRGGLAKARLFSLSWHRGFSLDLERFRLMGRR